MLDPVQAAIAELEAPDYLRNVTQWAADRLDIYMWSLPRLIAQLKTESKRVAVPACHDSAKSHTAAILGCHHIDTHAVGEARLITTAPSTAQVAGVLWGEINKMHDKARELGKAMPGRVNQMNWHIGNWQAGIGRKPNDYKPEQFAGFHARYPFIVLDEADGLPDAMWDGVEALMTNRQAKMLAIANPLDPGSRFATVLATAEAEEAALQAGTVQRKGEWVVLRIPYDQTPNFTGEIDRIPEPYRSLLGDVLLDPDWVESRRREWGGRKALEDPAFQPDHPFWYGRVLAVHPPEGAHQIMRWNDIKNISEPNEDVPDGMRQLGVDVAGSEKGDQTVCRERVGRHILRKWTLRSGDDDAIIDFIVDCAKQAQSSILCFDGTGMGTFVPGRLRAKLKNVAIIPINFSASATERHPDGSRKYENMRAQLWIKGREMSQEQAWDLSKAEDLENLQFELVAARYRPDVLSTKRIWQVESKDEIRARLGRSPDDADATLLACHRVTGSGPATFTTPRGLTIPTGAASVVRRT